jgi:hypothetical protein
MAGRPVLAERDEVIAKRRELACAIKRGLEEVKSRGPIKIMVHVVLPVPEQLDRCADLPRDPRSLDHVVVHEPPAEAAATAHHVNLDDRRRQAQGLSDDFAPGVLDSASAPRSPPCRPVPMRYSSVARARRAQGTDSCKPLRRPARRPQSGLRITVARDRDGGRLGPRAAALDANPALSCAAVGPSFHSTLSLRRALVASPPAVRNDRNTADEAIEGAAAVDDERVSACPARSGPHRDSRR